MGPPKVGPLAYLLVAAFVYKANADCSYCNRRCDLLFNGTDGEKISVANGIIRVIVAQGCEFLESLNRKYPNLNINEVSLRDLTGGASDDEQFPIVADLMDAKDRNLEVIDFNNPWILPLAEQLMPLPESLLKGIRTKFFTRNSDGKALTIPREANALYMYYRSDLFANNSVEMRTDTWEAWTESLIELRDKVRIRSGDPAWMPLHIDVVESAAMTSCLTMLFLSGENAGTVVENDGTVSINGPAGLKTLQMMASWKEQLVNPECFGEDPSSMTWMMRRGDVAVGFEWVTRASRLPGYLSRNGVDIRLAATPGSAGRGVSDAWEAGITNHTRNKDLAFEFIQALVDAQVMLPFSSTQEPTHTDTMTSETLWNNYCSATRTSSICQSMSSFPEFWDRDLAARPAGGCGPLVNRCLNAIKTGWDLLFLQGGTPAEVARSMEKDLNTLLGNFDAIGDDGVLKTWTSERIQLVVICVVCGVLFILLFMFMYNKISGLRKTGGCSLPISAFLGLSVLLLFCVIQVVGTNLWNTALRDISKDLGNRVQLETVKVTQLHLYTEAMAQITEAQDSNASMSQIRSYVKANFVSHMPSMAIDARSLVLLIDRDLLRVVVSSDKNKQEEKAYLHDMNSPKISSWTRVAMGIIGENLAEGFVMTSDIFSTTINGEPVMINFETARAEVRRWGRNRKRYELSYLIVNIVPEEVIFEEANKSLYRAVNVNAMMSVAALFVLVFLATFITLPLISLANDMEDVRAMRMDEMDLTKTSRLTELGSLIMGFQAMCAMLIEYKSFMPKTLFNDGDAEDDVLSETNDTTTLISKNDSRTSRASSRYTDRSSRALTVAKQKQGPSATQISVGAIKQQRGAILIISLLTERGKDMSPGTFEAVLSVVEASIGYGVLHAINTTKPGELVVSWGVAGNAVPVRTSSDKAAHAALELMHSVKKNLALACVSIKVSSGNIGNKHTRGFAIFGQGIEQAFQHVESAAALARHHKRSVTVVNLEVARLQGYDFAPVDSIKTHNNTVTINELKGSTVVEEQEWMYQLQQIAQKDPSPTVGDVIAKFLSESGCESNGAQAFIKNNDVPSTSFVDELRRLLDPADALDDVSLCVLIKRHCKTPQHQPTRRGTGSK
ncbi:hypothetical protein DIPPA_32947 [Diplonema papillatum]|nr:hypothetical protein DIPPA_27843 [Diplonema papillatum]KAJ9440889.1 hypothetical protein DIPPA_32947 [Diplonema papillatum]